MPPTVAPCAQGGAGLQRFLVGAADTVAALSTGGAADVALAVCAGLNATLWSLLGGVYFLLDRSAADVNVDVPAPDAA